MESCDPGTIALISLIVGLVTTGTEIGLQESNKPSTPKVVPPTAAQTAATANQTKQQQEAAVDQQIPGLQAQTGGSLSPEAYTNHATLLSGQANTPGIGASQQDIITKLLTGSSGSSGSSAAPVTAGGGGTNPNNTPGLTSGSSFA